MNIQDLIEKFETGDKPTGEDFADLINHCFNVNYKINRFDYPFAIPANFTVVEIEVEEDLTDAVFDVYVNNVLQNTTQYNLIKTGSGITLTFPTSVPAVRTGFVKINTIGVV